VKDIKIRTLYRSFSENLMLIILIGVFICCTGMPVTNGQSTKPELPKEKQTTLGLYVTAKGAYEKWKADPESVFAGQRTLNGWKNSGIPYTYTIDPNLMLIPNLK
jgi:hypothetical protein